MAVKQGAQPSKVQISRLAARGSASARQSRCLWLSVILRAASMSSSPLLTLCVALWMPPVRVGRPSPLAIEEDALRAAAAPLSKYNGSTDLDAPRLPRGWHVNRAETVIGHGRPAYERAANALQRLELLEHTWLAARCVCATDRELLAVCSRQWGCVWLTNTNLVLRRECGARRSSVSWGTTRRHVLAGEETVCVTHDASTDGVRFTVLSFSRPRHLFSAVAYPYVLAQQRRFARDATAAMERACGNSQPAG